ncbi:MAG: PIN domain-containing protein [Alphaproteobacteria bacterium]
MISCDTSTFIAYFQNEKARDTKLLFDALGEKKLKISPVVMSELLSAKNLTKKEEEIIFLIPTFKLKKDYWIRVGQSRRFLLQKKLKANMSDALIAQSCIDHNVPLITRDKDFRHYAKHCGLKLV